jgi:Protein of unknown function (DUF2997)
MVEVEVTIDTETGNATTEINGIQGPACESIAAEIKKQFGEPAKEDNKPEYHVRTQVRQQTKR